MSPNRHDIALAHRLDVQNCLGESVIWDHRSDTLWWTDIQSRRLYNWQFDGAVTSFDVPYRLCSFGLTEQESTLICAFEHGVAWFNPVSGQLNWLAQLSAEHAGMRLNDGRVDPAGRFWCGSMHEDGLSETPNGALYCLEKNRLIARVTGINISNSLCWNPDGDTLYFADSPTQYIRQFRFDRDSAQLDNEQTFIKTDTHAFPDGACTDSEGYLWSAQWGASQVCRYAPDGREVLRLDVPVPQPTCVAFAGKDLNFLCITSAYDGLEPQTRKTYPFSGDVFIFETPFTGRRESIFSQSAISGDVHADKTTVTVTKTTRQIGSQNGRKNV